MQILLVEPDANAAVKFDQALHAGGQVVIHATRAFEAIDLLRSGQFGMMITAASVADMDAVELVRLARRIGLQQYLYIMYLADRHDQVVVNNVLEAGADDYMSKPVDPVEMSLRVRNAQRIVSIDTRDDAIIAMARLAESRDACTGRHVERVRQYSRELAQAAWEMGHYFGQIDATFVELIYRASALHDLGKVAIPDSILLKPGKLTASEMTVMKTHTSLGAGALIEVLRNRGGCGFLTMGQRIAMFHHERWDGSGYPNGLREEQIPLAARIVSIADVYDALTSVRPYKDAMSHESALEYVIDGAGSQFDPLLVEAFAAIEKTVDQIHCRESEPFAQAPQQPPATLAA